MTKNLSVVNRTLNMKHEEKTLDVQILLNSFNGFQKRQMDNKKKLSDS
jgi:hypothetical protein